MADEEDEKRILEKEMEYKNLVETKKKIYDEEIFVIQDIFVRLCYYQFKIIINFICQFI